MTDRYADAHREELVNGPGDGRPIALQIIQDNGLEGKLTDKVALVTGCSSGIGIETARALKATGIKVFVTARNIAKGKEALKDILEKDRVELLELRLDSLTSVRACTEELKSRSSKLNILINNAGIMAVPTLTLTEDGFESHLETNHLGHFLLFQLLKPLLLASSTQDFNSRVVNVSSSGHRFCPINFNDPNLKADGAYNPWGAYGQSKTANILMANEIEKRYSSQGLHGWSLMPGFISSGLQIHVVSEVQSAPPRLLKRMKSSEQGAATSVWAAVGKVHEGKGGKYLEDVQVAGPFDGSWDYGPGYAENAFDEEAAGKLWELSNKFVGFQDD
jgi:NAD(P)-dependent dehydrogenase (short-subunit alcohol dehydrogenase family)